MERRAVYLGLLLFTATLLTLWAGYLILAPFIVPVAWALCLLTVTGGLYRRLASRTRMPRVSALLMTLAVAGGVVVPLILVGNAVVQEAIGISTRAAAATDPSAPKTGDKWDDFFSAHPDLSAIRDRIDRQLAPLDTNLRQIKDAGLAQLSQPFAKGAVAVLESLGTILFGFVMMLVTLYFLFRDGPAISAFVIDVVPMPEAETRGMIETLRSTAFAAIVGGLLTSLIQGFLGGVGLAITGVGAPVLWGFVMAVLSLLPFGGSAFVWAPVAGYFLATGEMAKGWFLIAWGAAVIGSSDNFLRPVLIRRAGAGEIHPLLLFFAVISGIGLFGFSGIVFGPLLVALVLGVVRIYRDHFGRRALEAKAAAERARSED